MLDRDGLERLFAAHLPLHILFNAAPGGERATGPFLKMDLDGFQGSVRKRRGYVNAVRLGAPHMTERSCCERLTPRKAQPGMAATSTVGNAVEGFARAVAPELAPRRINVVCPGFIDTPMFPVQGGRARRLSQATANNLNKRAGWAEEVADAILFLIRNEFATGTTVDVDGGALLP